MTPVLLTVNVDTDIHCMAGKPFATGSGGVTFVCSLARVTPSPELTCTATPCPFSPTRHPSTYVRCSVGEVAVEAARVVVVVGVFSTGMAALVPARGDAWAHALHLHCSAELIRSTFLFVRVRPI